MPKLQPGQTVEKRTWTTVGGKEVTLPDENKITHVQFRRHAGCPICGWHVKTFDERRSELDKQNIREVIVFHSTKDELSHQGEAKYDGNFNIISDPERKLYDEFGAEQHWSAQFTPTAMIKLPFFLIYMVYRYVAHGIPPPPQSPVGGRNQLPADILIGTDGKVISTYYGSAATDYWHFDDVLREAKKDKKGH